MYSNCIANPSMCICVFFCLHSCELCGCQLLCSVLVHGAPFFVLENQYLEHECQAEYMSKKLEARCIQVQTEYEDEATLAV
jgi:hypothetical protein